MTASNLVMIRSLSVEEQAALVSRVIAGEDLFAVAAAAGVSPEELAEWHRNFCTAGIQALGAPTSSLTDRRRRADVRLLEARIDRLTMTIELLRARIDFFRGPDGSLPPSTPDRLVALARAVSPSTHRRYGAALVGEAFDVARATIFRQKRAVELGRPRKRPGPKTHQSDDQLLDEIKRVITSNKGRWGYRKVCARLRSEGVVASKGRVLRLLRAAQDAVATGQMPIDAAPVEAARPATTLQVVTSEVEALELEAAPESLDESIAP